MIIPHKVILHTTVPQVLHGVHYKKKQIAQFHTAFQPFQPTMRRVAYMSE